MSKNIKILLICSFFLLSAGVASAGMFPNNAKTVMVDNHSTISSTILSATTTDRTILYASLYNSVNNDNHIRIGTTTGAFSNLNIIDSEGSGQSADEFMAVKLPAGQPLVLLKAVAGNQTFVTVTYTDYDLSLIGEYNNQTSTTSTSTLQYPSIPTSTIATTSPNTVGVVWTLLFFVTEMFRSYWPIILAIGIIIGFCIMVISFVKKISK
jgi:hypothetical protein